MRIESFSLGAGEITSVHAVGEYFRLLSADYNIRATFYGLDGEEISTTVLPGIGFRTNRFLQVDIETENANDIIIAISNKQVDDNRIVGSITAALQKAANNGTLADLALTAGTTEEILPVNTNRRAALVTSLGTSTHTARIGDLNAGAARGEPLEPGATVRLDATCKWYAYSPSGSSITLSRAWAED